MRIAVIADIHGNLPALEAVLSEVDRLRPDLIVSCGDVASGPMPAETIESLRRLKNARFVRGNADRGLVEEFDGKERSPMPGPFAGWCAAQLTREQRDFLHSFETRVDIEGVDGIGHVVFCHATPRNDTDVFTIETPDERVRTLMAGVDAELVVCGHTHMAFDRTVDGLRIVNPGSVGMPYGQPGAYWATLGPGVELRRTEYDLQAAAARMRAKHAEVSDQFATENVLEVPSVAQAMEFLRGAESKQIAAQA